MRVLSIDPGEHTGWALFDQKKVFSFGLILGVPSRNYHTMQNLVYILSPGALVIEVQYPPRTASVGFIRIVESRCAWQSIARAQEIPVYEANPSSWQAYFKLKSDLKIKSKYKRKKDFKEKIVQKSKEVSGLDINKDASDAFLIGTWFIEKNND